MFRVNADIVRYACTCGLLKPLTMLYFCRHCLELRCSFCVSHEVDSHFCGKCSENLPSSEARLKKNRCGNCYDCPSCLQPLSTRAANVGVKSPEDAKSTPRKVFYLYCQVCRWSSRDVGIPDQAAANGGWPERENVHADRLQTLHDTYKNIMLLEKQQKLEREKRKQKKYRSFTDKTGITGAMLRKRLGIPEPVRSKAKLTEIEPAIAQEDIEEFPENIFTHNIVLSDITTIEQRLMQPEWQPTTIDKLFPTHKQLSVKCSQRCRKCEHNVSKPEYNPNSIKFKIQLFAYYHIPEVRIVTVEPLRAGQPSELLLKFINPAQYQTNIFLLNLQDFDTKEITRLMDFSIDEDKPSSTSQPSSLVQTTLSRQPPITIKPRPIVENVTATFSVSSSTFILPARDDAAEYDDSVDTHNIQDDSKLVVFRKSNKAVIKAKVTPHAVLKIGDKVVVGFALQHIYMNTIAAVENKESKQHNHLVKVFLTLGNLVGSE